VHDRAREHAARRLADPRAPRADERREALAASSGLSRAGVDLALSRCLEISPSEAELEALCASVDEASRSHVLLSANVFVAAHRAIALALAASAEICVRPSRREPEMTRWLAEEARGLFDVVETLAPSAGEQVFAYGADSTLATLARTLPAGVRLLGHGAGFGLVACYEAALASAEQRERAAAALALDIVLFDQRGCLSPRLVLFEGSRAGALRFAETLANALSSWEARAPRGYVSREDLAESARYAATLTYTGEIVPAAFGVIGIAPANGAVLLPPAGRNLHVIPISDAAASAKALSPHVTTFAVLGSDAQEAALAGSLPSARPAKLGLMQCPAFDGPVDRRAPMRSALATFF
jgi:hypothetical protein